MTDTVRPLSRPQIARIVNGDPEAIRFLEGLFRMAGQTTPTDVTALQAQVAVLETILGDGDKGDVILSGHASSWVLDYPAVSASLNLSGVNTGDQTITLTGDVHGSGQGSFPSTIQPGVVTYAKMQNTGAASVLLGRGDAGVGEVQEISLGAGLSMTGAVLSASGGGGGANTGTATLNFGAAPGGNIAVATIAGQAAILGTAKIKVWLQGDTSANFNAYEHAYVLPAALSMAATNIVPGTGFDIVAATELRLTGEVTCRWEWSA